MAETGLKLRTATPCGDWRSFVVTVDTPAVEAGEMDQIHDTVGVYMQDADPGEDVAFCYHAEKIVVPKSTTTGAGEFDPGDKVYYDPTDHNVNNDSQGNLWCGIALEHVHAEATEVLIDLKGDKAT